MPRSSSANSQLSSELRHAVVVGGEDELYRYATHDSYKDRLIQVLLVVGWHQEIPDEKRAVVNEFDTTKGWIAQRGYPSFIPIDAAESLPTYRYMPTY